MSKRECLCVTFLENPGPRQQALANWVISLDAFYKEQYSSAVKRLRYCKLPAVIGLEIEKTRAPPQGARALVLLP